MLWSGLVLFVALAAPAAEGAKKATPPPCVPGTPCVCRGTQACEIACTADPKQPEKGCDFACAGIGSCTFHCPGGHCTAKATGAGAAELRCPGGDCTFTASGAGACDLNDCKHGCKLACKGAGACWNSCAGPGCSCTGKGCDTDDE